MRCAPFACEYRSEASSKRQVGGSAVVTFVDRVVLHATGGDGGHGCASIHREKFKPLGRPRRRQRRQRWVRDHRGRPAGHHAARLPPPAAPARAVGHPGHGRPPLGLHGRRPGAAACPTAPSSRTSTATSSRTSSASARSTSRHPAAAGDWATPRWRRPVARHPGFALLGEPGEARTSCSSSRRSRTSRSSAIRAPASPASSRPSRRPGPRSPTTRSRRWCRTSASSRRVRPGTRSPTSPV